MALRSGSFIAGQTVIQHEHKLYKCNVKIFAERDRYRIAHRGGYGRIYDENSNGCNMAIGRMSSLPKRFSATADACVVDSSLLAVYVFVTCSCLDLSKFCKVHSPIYMACIYVLYDTSQLSKSRMYNSNFYIFSF